MDSILASVYFFSTWTTTLCIASETESSTNLLEQKEILDLIYDVISLSRHFIITEVKAAGT